MSNYYVKTKRKWMSMLDKQIKASKDSMINRYGDKQGQEMLEEIRLKFEELLPGIPQLDPKASPIWTRQLVLTAIFLSVYKVTTEQYNMDKEGAWEICMITFGSFLKSMPKPVKWLALKGVFSQKRKTTLPMMMFYLKRG